MELSNLIGIFTDFNLKIFSMLRGEKLNEWIIRQLEERGWSQRELGRRSGFSGPHVSNVLQGQAPASWDFCAAVARVFEERPEKVFRLAGLLKVSPDGSDLKPDELELLELYQSIKTKRGKRLLRRAIQMVLEGEQDEEERVGD